MGAAAVLTAAAATVLTQTPPKASAVIYQSLSGESEQTPLAGIEVRRNAPETEMPRAASQPKSITMSGGGWKAAATPCRAPRRLEGAGSATPEQMAGWYMEYDTVRTSSGLRARISGCRISVAPAEQTSRGNLQILTLAGTNFRGCYATVSGSALTIPAGNYCPVSNSSGQQMLALVCPVNIETMQYYPNSPIQATVLADGSVKFPSWGIFVVDSTGTSASVVEIMASTRIEHANGVMSGKQWGAGLTIEWPVKITQTHSNRLTVENFANTGAPALVDLSYAGRIEVVPQYMGSSLQYGELDCMPLGENGSGQPDQYIVAQAGENNVVAIPDWGVCALADPGKYLFRLTEARLTLHNVSLRLPAKFPAAFSGSGSQEAPYMINSYSDLMALSQLVADGADQKGIYYKLGADIDCGGQDFYFQPIGGVARNTDFVNNANPLTGNAFRGHLDGGNHTISGIDYTTGRRSYTGIVSWLGSEGSISHLRVNQCRFLTEGVGLGAVAGFNEGLVNDCQSTDNQILFTSYNGGGICGGSRGIIENCLSSSVLMGYGNMGGICGGTTGTLRGCQARGSLTVVGIDNSMFCNAGGLTGTINGSFSTDGAPALIERCIAAAAITDRTSDGCTGGMIGATLCGSSKTPPQIRENLCIATIASNAASIQTGASTYSNGRVGGLIGNFWRANVSDCFVTGVVMAPRDPKYCGAIVGYIMSDKDNKVSGLVSSCQMIVSNATPKPANAIYSELTKTYMAYFTNVYYDRQSVGLDFKDFSYTGALSTADMTGAGGLAGLDASKWTFTAGLYPQLKALSDNGAMQVAAAPIMLAGDESSRMVMHDFTLSTANNVRWGVMTENALSTTGQGLDIVDGNRAVLKNEFGRDILCAYINGMPFLKQVIVNTIPSQMFSGSGTEADPYQIKDLNDLKNLQEATTTYNMTYEGAYFKVMNDIDCHGDIGFEGIASDGVTTHEFSGTFDGAGHVIDNIVLNKSGFDDNGKAVASGSVQYSGFIGRLSSKGTVKNVILGPGCRMTFWANSGAISGFVAGRIENCVNRGRVDGMSTYIGGIAGSVQTTGLVTGCVNEGIVRSGMNYIGGIAAQNNNIVEYCQNNGIVLSDSINPAHRRGNGNYAGGIVGNLTSKTVRYCVNQGTVKGHKAAGGIYGYYSGAATMTGCLNTGIVISDAGADMGALGGGGTSTTAKFTDNYYDGQLMTAGAIRRSSAPGCEALNTSALTSGTPLKGLPEDVFDYAAGMYPVLKSQVGAEASTALRHMYITLPAGMNLNDVRGSIPLSSFSGLSWSMKPGSSPIYSVTGNTLTAGDITDKTIQRGTITATAGGYSRSYGLTSVPDMFDGKGTAEQPYLINSKQDMLLLAQLVNDDGLEFNGKHFLLTADLDYTADTTFVQIGAGNGCFGGIFNGNDKRILNLKVRHISGMALFGTITEGGGVRNLTLQGGEFSAPGKTVTGFAYTCNGTVENCRNYNVMNAGPDTKATSAAGFVYTLQGKGRIINCDNYGHIMGRSGTSGGIVSVMERGSLVSGCNNYGDVLVNSTQVGGIAGKCQGTIRDCSNTVNMEGKSAQFAGIAGYALDTCRIENCINTGNIKVLGAANKAGGLIGYSNGVTVISGSVNRGSVISESTSTSGYIGGLIGHGIKASMSGSANYGAVECLNGQYTGGLIGYADMSTNYKGTVDSCYNYGDVKGGNKYVGGLFGYQRGDYTNSFCGNYGNVTGTGSKAVSDNTAGVAGYSYGDFSSCFNTGTVEAKGVLTAGFLSEGSGNRIIDCLNTGSVTSTGTNATATRPAAAGFWATGRSDSLANCYNMGAVSGKNFTSGFIGNFTTSVKVTGCYNAGSVTTTDNAGTAAAFMISTPGGTNVIDGNYWDNNIVSPNGGNTNAAEGRPTADFMNFAPTDAYLATAACYPTLKSMSANVAANFAAAQLRFKTDEESEDNVLHSMTIGLLHGVVWSCSPELEIAADRVLLLVKDKAGTRAWLEKKAGDLSHRYQLTLNDCTGVDGIDSDTGVLSRSYFTPEGLRVTAPSPGQILIVKTVYTDGTATVSRIIYR